MDAAPQGWLQTCLQMSMGPVEALSSPNQLQVS